MYIVTNITQGVFYITSLNFNDCSSMDGFVFTLYNIDSHKEFKLPYSMLVKMPDIINRYDDEIYVIPVKEWELMTCIEIKSFTKSGIWDRDGIDVRFTTDCTGIYLLDYDWNVGFNEKICTIAGVLADWITYNYNIQQRSPNTYTLSCGVYIGDDVYNCTWLFEITNIAKFNKLVLLGG